MFVAVILAAASVVGDLAGADTVGVKADTSLSATPDTSAIDSMQSEAALRDSLQAIVSKMLMKGPMSPRARRLSGLSGRSRSAWPDNMPVVFPDTSGLRTKVVVPKGHFQMPIMTPHGWQGASERVDSGSIGTADSTQRLD